MKAGARAVGVAESYRGPSGDDARGAHRPASSTLAAVVVRADRSVDGFAFATCTVGGTDATATVVALLSALARADVQYVLVAGIAPAWYNLVDLVDVEAATGRPVLSVSFEDSSGLEPAIRREFAGDEASVRLSTYERQPPRSRLDVNGETVFVRAVGIEPAAARDVVRAFTPEGGRPEPLRVARLAARAADRFRTDS